MRILHVASEIFPLVKTGGLADVVAALPPALVKRGLDARVLLADRADRSLDLQYYIWHDDITGRLLLQSLLDAAARGDEGPWATYARMLTLRSPKQLIGPDLGVPSLTFRAWYEAQHGRDGWEKLYKIARLDWLAYLLWVREVVGLAVENGVALETLTPAGDLLTARLSTGKTVHARKVVIANGKASVTREIDGGLETLDITLPAVVSTDLRLNEPRYATLPNIMKAKKKPLETVKPAELGVDVAPRLTTLKVVEPAARSAGIKVADVAQLIDKLKNEAKVL